MCKANLLISGIFIFQREKKKKLMWFFPLAIGISYFIYHIVVTNILVRKEREGKKSEKDLNLKSTGVGVKMGKAIYAPEKSPTWMNPHI